MDMCHINIASHFLGWSGAQNPLFCLKFEQVFGRKDTLLTISKGVSYAIKDWLIHSYSFNKDYETLKWQFLCVLTIQHHISLADLVPKIRYFAPKLWAVFGRIPKLLTHKGVLYAIIDCSNHSYSFKEGSETLKWQWICVFTTQHHIFWADLVPQSRNFV